MAKDAQLYVRVTEEEKAQLEQLAEMTKRTQSDMVRWLIQRAWDEYRSLPVAAIAAELTDQQAQPAA